MISVDPIWFSFPVLMQLRQRGLHCILWWWGSHGDNLEVYFYALELASWLGLGYVALSKPVTRENSNLHPVRLGLGFSQLVFEPCSLDVTAVFTLLHHQLIMVWLGWRQLAVRLAEAQASDVCAPEIIPCLRVSCPRSIPERGVYMTSCHEAMDILRCFVWFHLWLTLHKAPGIVSYLNNDST